LLQVTTIRAFIHFGLLRQQEFRIFPLNIPGRQFPLFKSAFAACRWCSLQRTA
jgi:hypothetical protein